MEFNMNHKFGRHAKAWGPPHVGEGIRFVCESDSIDDPDHRGLRTTLKLWNRWRHDTYKDDREAEVQFLDELPVVKAVSAPPLGPVQYEKRPAFAPEIKNTSGASGSGSTRCKELVGTQARRGLAPIMLASCRAVSVALTILSSKLAPTRGGSFNI